MERCGNENIIHPIPCVISQGIFAYHGLKYKKVDEPIIFQSEYINGFIFQNTLTERIWNNIMIVRSRDVLYTFLLKCDYYSRIGGVDEYEDDVRAPGDA